MNKSKKSLNEDELMQEKLKRCLYISIGRLLIFIRTISPLTLEKLQEISSVNSGMIWRMEQIRNYSILSYAQAIHYYLKSVKCIINIHNIFYQVAKALLNGKCIVMFAVNSDQLSEYASNQILLRQQSDDVEELDRRRQHREATLLKNRKRGEARWKKKSEAKQKKEGEAKRQKKSEEKRQKKESPQKQTKQKKTQKS
ncbi:hypothetical protein [Bacteroides caecimuris]|jgi:hypothetical protein|uniref:Uncharacterized protein n=1 Tax=Bacteroides caecimuris TaxID=1796613 RepID=A0A1C7H1F7_9BACE|nr:hypothetical protein [Bacteroides caecimuris]ANU57367.1 hypothetical protein A4V03_07145 [Bacteroides caecimuris]OXE64540.1 hypothetical protein ADH74_09090 [Bacteroides caecimuris]QQR17757.1 hypothetical protein I5Q79_02020 [Bacteroides caecimuris]UQA30755.1 hypothetical protein M2854_02070 [Bacteroides caecimuris]